jgi:hypothetical protein
MTPECTRIAEGSTQVYQNRPSVLQVANLFKPIMPIEKKSDGLKRNSHWLNL